MSYYINLALDVYHSINRFMATDGGELFKKSVEFILFFLVTYMIASEYGRTKEKHLKYLLFGFAALAIDKFIMSIVFAFIVFGNAQVLFLNPFLAVLDLFLEIMALILLTNSFIFPAFADKLSKLKRKMETEIVGLIFIFLAIQILWLVKVFDEPTAAFRNELSYLVLQLIKILVLYSPIYYIVANYYKFGKYGPHIMLAFLVYMITPVIDVVNIVFFGGLSKDLRVLAHPFPFISVLLITRVTYLKLVDKAVLKKELEETKRKYIEEHELNKLKDDFVSTVSHELRTPLTSMKLYLALLKGKKFGTLNKKQRTAVDVVEKESNRLTNLINDVLSLSRLESKKSTLRIEEVNLNRLVKDNLYYNLAEKKGLVIDNKVPKKFMVSVDVEKFKQVFINLFSNAMNYAEKRVTISAEKTKKGWKFIVADDGPGIPKEKQGKLFEKFYRVEDYLTKEKQGTGLGLAIVKNIVEMHKGKAYAESKPGEGSRFIVEIPNSLS